MSDDARTDAEWVADALATEVDRLRAELDRHRVAGGELAAASDELFRAVREDAPAVQDRLTDLRRTERAWRSVRGDAPAAPAGTFNAELGVAPAAAPTDGQAPADDDMAVRRRAATAITAFRDALPVEHFDRERAQLDRLAEWLERGGSNYWNAPAHALVRALAAAPADDTATPPTSVALRTTLRQIADEAVGVEGILQPGAAYALGKLADLVRAQPGCLPEHVADAITATADDTAAPDGPTADEAVASAARIVEAWAHLRMDTPEDQATHDELVRVSRATIAAYVRTRPWSRAGQPVRDSQPETT